MYNCIVVSKCLNHFEDIARTISLTLGLHKCESKERRKKVTELIARKDKIIKVLTSFIQTCTSMCLNEKDEVQRN